MLTTPDCLVCILGDVFAAARQTTDGATALRVARAASGYLAREFDYSLPPSYHITAVHRILKAITGVAEPFAERRRQTNAIGIDISERIKHEIDAEHTPGARIRQAALWALAANSLDSRTAGMGYSFDPEGAYDYLFGYYQKDPALDSLDELAGLLAPGMGVVYIHDNVGEIALDGLLIAEMRNTGCHVTSAVRGGPITSDATWDDALAVGLDRQVDRLILAGPDTLGVSFAEMSPDLRAALAGCDLVVAKGQANYYVLSEHWPQVRGRVFSLFTVKCQVVAAACGVPRRATIAAFLPMAATGTAPRPAADQSAARV